MIKSKIKYLCLIMVCLFALTGCNKSSEPKLDANDIAVQLQDSGLQIEKIKSYTEDDDPNELLGRPNQYTSKVIFSDSRIEQNDIDELPVGGTIEVFENSKDAKDRYDYIEAVTSEASIFQQYMYLHDTVFMRLEYDLTPAEAQEYDDSLLEILK